MSPCSAKIASASREEGLPALAVAGAAEAGGRGAELARALAEDLHAPDVDLLQLVELGRHALEVEHDVVRVLGDRGRLEQDRLAARRARGRWRGSGRRSAPTFIRRLPQGRSSSASGSSSKRSRSWSIVSTPCALELGDQAAVDPRQQADRAALDRRRPAALEEAAARALRPSRPSSCGSSSARRSAEDLARAPRARRSPPS